jgi:uncharacterized protein (DUF1810 family)
MSDPFDLQRFVDAQSPVYEQVRGELMSGRKTSHWMWFVFPQLRGLGRSEMARRYGIESHEEAVAYLSHSLLGARLRECTGLMLSVPDLSATRILGTPDDLKFASCMTLFDAVAPQDPLFRRALERFCDGRPDGRTLELLTAGEG